MIRMPLQLHGMTVSKNIGHVPLNWSKMSSKFLQFTNHYIHVEVTGKRVNCGVGLGLKISVNYLFIEMQKLQHGWKITVCSYRVKYAFQSESTLYSRLNVKERLTRNRREIWILSDCNWTRTHNHLVRSWNMKILAS